jgi:gluconolactonase
MLQEQQRTYEARWLPCALVVLCAALAGAQQQPAIPGVVAAGTQVELVQESFSWAEGPVGTPDGGLYFNDVRSSRLYRLDPADKLTTVREDSGGANGLAFDHAGDLYAAEGAEFALRGIPGKRISRQNQTGHAVTVADKFNGQPFGAPNDLILDAKGGIYFTDPGTHPFDDPNHRGDVYYLPPGAREPTKIDDQVKLPNGVTLTMDGKTLLVIDTIGANILRYDVQADGRVKNRRVFATLPQPTEGRGSADSMCIDSEDRIYAAGGAGIQVFDRSGEFLGTIKIPRNPANCAFSGPDKRTLYVTAREGLYRVRTLARGPDRPGK